VAIGLFWNVNGGKITLGHEKAEEQIQAVEVGRIHKQIESITESASDNTATPIWAHKTF